MDVPARFTSWIKNLVFAKRTEGNCIAISVKHLAGKSTNDVAKIACLKAEEIEEGEVDSQVSLFADNLWSLAQNDADAFQGMQTYAFYSWFEGQPDKPFNRYTARFCSAPDEEEMGEESASESPTGQGLVQASMRHAEAFARIGTQASMHQLAMQQRTIDSQQKLIERLTSQRLETAELMENLQSEKHKRDMELREQEAKMKLQEELLKKFVKFLPAAVSKFTGVPMLPEGNVAKQPVKELLASITPDQMDKLGNILTPEQQGFIAKMMMEQQDEETSGEIQ